MRNLHYRISDLRERLKISLFLFFSLPSLVFATRKAQKKKHNLEGGLVLSPRPQLHRNLILKLEFAKLCDTACSFSSNSSIVFHFSSKVSDTDRVVPVLPASRAYIGVNGIRFVLAAEKRQKELTS